MGAEGGPGQIWGQTGRSLSLRPSLMRKLGGGSHSDFHIYA